MLRLVEKGMRKLIVLSVCVLAVAMSVAAFAFKGDIADATFPASAPTEETNIVLENLKFFDTTEANAKAFAFGYPNAKCVMFEGIVSGSDILVSELNTSFSTPCEKLEQGEVVPIWCVFSNH